jgi:2-oxoglutarate dehydrogenase E2 component (dihydrolipoamide succinyltransferase)
VTSPEVVGDVFDPAYVQVLMPQLGGGVETALVARWLKTVGELVEVGEPLVEISTGKVDTEIPAPAAGTLKSIIAIDHQEVAVGAVMALIAPYQRYGDHER